MAPSPWQRSLCCQSGSGASSAPVVILPPLQRFFAPERRWSRVSAVFKRAAETPPMVDYND